MKNNQNGFSAIAIVVAVVAVIVVAGLITWRVLDANKTPSAQAPDNTASQQQPEPQKQPDPNEGYVVIKEWGVRFKPVEGLVGVQYFKPADLSADHLTFTTATLAEASADCKQSTGRIVLGLLSRGREEDSQSGGVLAKIGDYVYQYRAPQAACSDKLTFESDTIISLSRSLDSLEAMK